MNKKLKRECSSMKLFFFFVSLSFISGILFKQYPILPCLLLILHDLIQFSCFSSEWKICFSWCFSNERNWVFSGQRFSTMLQTRMLWNIQQGLFLDNKNLSLNFLSHLFHFPWEIYQKLRDENAKRKILKLKKFTYKNLSRSAEKS